MNNNKSREAKYGLPSDVRFCKKCVMSNQRAAPSIVTQDQASSKKKTAVFNDDGVCDACRVVGKKFKIDWADRESQLKDLLDKHRSNDGSYDCVVPGSGGKDSIYAAHILKTKYGMNPLTVTWSPHLYTEVGWSNFQSWIHNGGFDNYLFTANGQVQRKLTQLSYKNLLHPFQPFTLGQRNFPVNFAKKMGIKLVFYGENAAEYGSGPGEDETSKVPVRFYTKQSNDPVFISGLPLQELVEEHGIKEAHIDPYIPILVDDVKEVGIDVRYLGYFLKWVPQECYYYSVENVGFKANTERTEGTFSKYNSIDDKMDGFHYWTGFIKFGIGRTTHEAAQEIRNRHITRDEGIALVRKFDGEFPHKYFPEILEYLNMEEDEFMSIADNFRSPHLWKFRDNKWKLRNKIN
jgi:N-acetyl sugar amidotransferase